MFKIYYLVCFLVVGFISCTTNTSTTETTSSTKEDSVKIDTLKTVAQQSIDSIQTPCTNDSLKELAKMIAGINDSTNSKVLTDVFSMGAFKRFSEVFEKRWEAFDTSRLQKLIAFRKNEISPVVGKTKTLFYPFSGPDILYGYTFFPDANKYILLGLEPVGTRPIYDEKKEGRDSLRNYFNKVNTSLHAILKFSFFRTQSMKVDLRNNELDGTLHLLLLFLERTKNSICQINPVYIDTTGAVKKVESFTFLKNSKLLNKGVEIVFFSPDGKQKTLYYYSLNIANSAVKQNKGMLTYLDNLGEINTYLKGASYLMHKDYFSVVKDAIMKHSKHVIQDDSGIAFHYFTESGYQWNYTLYGKYIHPIPMFSMFFQKDLDSTYKALGSKPIGFGIGYNFKDKNSNFMIATKQ